MWRVLLYTITVFEAANTGDSTDALLRKPKALWEFERHYENIAKEAYRAQFGANFGGRNIQDGLGFVFQGREMLACNCRTSMRIGHRCVAMVHGPSRKRL